MISESLDSLDFRQRQFGRLRERIPRKHEQLQGFYVTQDSKVLRSACSREDQ